MTIVLYELAGAKDERFSPYCWRVRFALAHKGLSYETRGLAFTEIPRAVGAPHRTVPIIDDDGVILSDSWTIADHLDRTYPERPLFGPDGREKAAYKFIEAWTNQMLTPAMVPLLVFDIYGRIKEKDKAYFRETREKRVGPLEQAANDADAKVAALPKLLAPFHYALEQRPWLGGEAPDYADYILAGTLQWARIVSPVQLIAPEDPLTEWFERCLDLFDGSARAMPAARAA
ncbi:glutathione S-transferase N-terminal domain-containing protein [Rhodoligotrophos defluvii]|uniref:glutathione S-transferase N-terminal domain-containing protein n=1 Tax=Rhodoligotrophos defluvii TaxID=2561934 RepID=UPI0010C9FE5F|nr:glutathione S-transferase N-terminal domain-containing protein [Rhodoligotrophos defluvii]